MSLKVPLIERRAPDRIGLIGHVIADYPSPQTCRTSLQIMAESGVDLIEVQIPFSEPMADGPLFLKANQEALNAGVRVDDAFELVRECFGSLPPLVFMSYANVIYRMGYEAFAEKAADAGGRGVIVPDLAFDVASSFYDACRRHGIATIPVVPPNIAPERLELLCREASGFIYVMARAGVTGKKTSFGQELFDLIDVIRNHTSLPVAVGFGVSSAEDVAALRGHADYAVVGSRALRVAQNEGLESLRTFWCQLAAAGSATT